MWRRLLSLLLGALLFPLGGAGAQQVKLRATLQVPVSDPSYGVSLVRFKEEVERHSKGAISIAIFDKGQLFRDDEVVAAVSSGAVDIGIAASDRFVGRSPAVGILGLPFLFNFEALARSAAMPGSEVRQLIDKAILAETGVRVLWWQPLGNTVIYSKGRDAADPERISGQRVGVPSRRLAEFVVRCGGNPSVLSGENLPVAVKHSALDMAMDGLAALESRELWKVMDTVTRTEHAPVEFFLVINEKTWQLLDISNRAILADVAHNVELETRDLLSEFEARAYAIASVKGMKVRQLTPDQVAEWRACSAEMLADYMNRHGELAQRLMAAYGKLRTEPCCTAGPSPATFTRR
jgi:C4-dicarboxylate-binding protein DctP